MINRWVFALLVAGIAATLPAALSAQQPSSKAKQTQQKAPPNDPYSEELTPRQIERAQEPDPTRDPASGETKQAPKAKAPAQPSQPARTIACSGAFAKDTSHVKLMTVYKPDNVELTQVDSGGTKVTASVLFPKDPKRRLEVWWLNEAARQGIHLIVLNGQSTWTGPKGLRLGLQLAALEKLNGKPFKLRGFDKDNVSLINDWQGGALANIPGGCGIGASMRLDPKTPQDARDEVSGDKAFLSNDALVKAVKPVTSEVLIGY